MTKVFVAAQNPKDPGVLMLSQFAGAAEQMDAALMVNPHDPEQVATSILTALMMSRGERRERYNALMDGLTRLQVIWKITLPLSLPGVISGYLLAFIISLDDFIITNFVKGAGMETLPTAIFGAVKQGIKPNIMAISSILLAVSVGMVALSWAISRRDPTK